MSGFSKIFRREIGNLKWDLKRLRKYPEKTKRKIVAYGVGIISLLLLTILMTLSKYAITTTTPDKNTNPSPEMENLQTKLLDLQQTIEKHFDSLKEVRNRYKTLTPEQIKIIESKLKSTTTIEYDRTK